MRRTPIGAMVVMTLGVLMALPYSAPTVSIVLAADSTVYADGLASGWEDWSWDATVNLASTAPVHGGNRAIATTITKAWGALRLHSNTVLSGSSYSAISFWIHGGASGGQALQFIVLKPDDTNWDKPFTVTPQANTWTQVTVPLSSVGSPAQIADLVWQDASGAAKPTFSVDDVVLIGATSGGGSTFAPMQFNENANVGGFQSNLFSWYDRGGKLRTAALVKNDRQDPKGMWGGYMRQFTYSLGNTTRTVVGSEGYHPGFGYTTNHYGQDGLQDQQSHTVKGTYTAILRGRHHAIHLFKWRLNLGGPVDATVQWFFATGRDYPLWTITYDSSPAGPNVVKADTRSPYGDMQWDGGGNTPVSGVGWGDRYKFRSLGSPISMNSGWDYTQPNLVPYVFEYTNNPDAEMGLVQTQTYLQRDAGGYWFYSQWGKSDPDGPMPPDYNWTYQLNQYELPFTNTSKRMAWGSNFGAVGQTSYPAYGDDKTLSGYPYLSYSVFIVLDKHSLDPVNSQVVQIERVQKTILTASTGTVVTSGPAGIGRSDTVTYAPAGYDHVYSTWNIRANNNNQATFTLNPTQGALINPIVVIHNYRAVNAPERITINGATKIADVDYFASVDPSTQRLWITLNGSFSGSNVIAIDGAAAAPTASTYAPYVRR